MAFMLRIETGHDELEERSVTSEMHAQIVPMLGKGSSSLNPGIGRLMTAPAAKAKGNRSSACLKAERHTIVAKRVNVCCGIFLRS